MWKIEFAKNELNNISDLIVSSGSLATRSWRTVWFATLKPGQAFHDYAEQGKDMSHDLWDESQKKHYSGLAHPLFHPWNSSRAMRIYKWCTEKTPQRSPDGEQRPSLTESLRAHESLVDLSFQMTSFLPKSWTLSSSDKTFLILSLGILTLRIYAHRNHYSVPLNLEITCYAVTLTGITINILFRYIHKLFI